MASTIIIGIGNPLRSDDGIGWAIGDILEHEFACNPEIMVITVHQLTPELAQQVAIANKVIFIDASPDGPPGQVRVTELSPSEQQPGMTFHQLDPAELLSCALHHYGTAPPAALISVTGASFALGEHLSRSVSTAVPHVLAQVKNLVTQKHGVTADLEIAEIAKH